MHSVHKTFLYTHLVINCTAYFCALDEVYCYHGKQNFMNDNFILLFLPFPYFFGLLIALSPVAVNGFSCFLMS
jgi:hypothetical protein